jgi:hypothetical protein
MIVGLMMMGMIGRMREDKQFFFFFVFLKEEFLKGRGFFGGEGKEEIKMIPWVFAFLVFWVGMGEGVYAFAFR